MSFNSKITISESGSPLATLPVTPQSNLASDRDIDHSGLTRMEPASDANVERVKGAVKTSSVEDHTAEYKSQDIAAAYTAADSSADPTATRSYSRSGSASFALKNGNSAHSVQNGTHSGHRLRHIRRTLLPGDRIRRVTVQIKRMEQRAESLRGFLNNLSAGSVVFACVAFSALYSSTAAESTILQFSATLFLLAAALSCPTIIAIHSTTIWLQYHAVTSSVFFFSGMICLTVPAFSIQSTEITLKLVLNACAVVIAVICLIFPFLCRIHMF